MQMAVARGALVVGTASERNHDFLRSLGAEPTTYGPGLVEP
jgi:NADPH:quinone reductase-like Zn-dependent oxidoreductase